MGKNFGIEIADLSRTYGFARAADIASLSEFVRESACASLVVVGSGGSHSAAQFMADLHQRAHRQMAKAVTPLDLIANVEAYRQSVVCLLTSGGRNRDIQRAFETAAACEVRDIGVVVASPNAPIAALAAACAGRPAIEFTPPSGKDGFLATNSLMLVELLLARAYLGPKWGDELADTLDEFRERAASQAGSDTARVPIDQVVSRETLVVLHDMATRASAVDLESKFTEAALGHVQLADLRSFGHGRHHWLAKHGVKSAVLALTATESSALAQRTLSALPEEVLCCQFEYAGDPTTVGVASLLDVFDVVAAAGRQVGIDPGRPGVPRFGSRIYRLAPPAATKAGATRQVPVPVQRKLARLGSVGPSADMAASWLTALNRFEARLRKAELRAVVFDYDGTLCDARDRGGNLQPQLVQLLCRLLEAGVLLGIATGRGDSVRSKLREAFPEEIWPLVHVAYYNGGVVESLANDWIETGEPVGVLAEVYAQLRAHPAMQQAVAGDWRCSPRQLGLHPVPGLSSEELWRVTSELLILNHWPVTALCSAHSIDIVASGVSKLDLLPSIEAAIGESAKASCLVVGDRGAWPGNDHALLQMPLSLSVDQVSADFDTCWNLAPPGTRGVAAAVWYLEHLRLDRGVARWARRQAKERQR